MHIVVIGWVYVVLMMALTETSITAGVLTFVLYALVPLAIILYVSGGPQRWRARRQQSIEAAVPPEKTAAADDQSDPPPPA